MKSDRKIVKSKVSRGLAVALSGCMILQAGLPVNAYTPPKGAETQLQEGYASDEGAYAIYPVPQSVRYGQGEFQLGKTVNVVYEEGIDTYTQDFLEEILESYGIRAVETAEPVIGQDNILLGTAQSGKAVDRWVGENVAVQKQNLFQETDAYLLSAEDGTFAILGRDTDAAYCAVATLQMMFSSFAGKNFQNVQIEDYASMAMRGFIEGFYGGWDYEGRESLMRFARDLKMNTYVYASKSDAYHKSDALYPKADIEKIADLVEVGKKMKVQYAWSVHISYFFNRLSEKTVGSPEYEAAFEENFTKLIAKFQQLYDAGVRKFDVLNDDFGAGTHAEVVRLLNRVNEEFLQPKGCERMSYCPQGYNESWSKAPELEALKSLDDTIDIYWTGADVNSPISQSTVNFLKEKTGHDPVFWLNYPVNEHGASGVYLGNITHYARDGVTGLAGAVSNPSRFTETNKVGLFQLAALFWNNQDYLDQAETIWAEAFKYLQPEVYDAYLTIASNVSNCPGSGRVPAGFPESEYLKDTLGSVTEKIGRGEMLEGDSEVQALLEEFAHIAESIEVFRTNCDNQNLVSELDPWLSSLKDIAVGGQAALRCVIAIQDEDADGAWRELGTASKAMDGQDRYPTFEGSDKMALAGSRYLVPFVSKAVIAAKNLLTPYLNPNSEDFTPSFYAMLGGTVQGDSGESAKIFDGDAATYGGYTKTQEAGDYFGVDLGRVLPVHSISILQGKNDTDHDYFHNGCLEYSRDGENWTVIARNVDAHKMNVKDIHIQARYIRLRLTVKGTASKPDYWTYIREFAVNKETEAAFGAISSQEDLIFYPVSAEDRSYTLGEVKGAQLEPGGYLGVKLKELAGIEAVQTQMTGGQGTVLQYSENGVIWKQAPSAFAGEAARYVRIYNGTDKKAEFDLKELKVTVNSVSMHPSVTESSFDNLKEGSWENLFDGNHATFAWTNTAQKAGQYILVDLGATVPVHDLRITTEDGNPRLYNAKIQVSQDKQSWEDVAEVVDGGKDAVRDNIFYRITKDLDGKQVRYLKLLITGDSGYFLKLCDIEINKSIQSGSYEITGSFSQDLEKMIDGNISTVCAASEISDGSAFIEYKITEHTKMNSVTFLQDASELTGAQVKAMVYNGSSVEERTLGTLDAGSKTFQLNPKEDVLSFKVIWPEGTTPILYEIITASAENGGSQGEETTFPEGKQVYKLGRENLDAITAPYGTALKDLKLPQDITVTYVDNSTETLGFSWFAPDYRPYQAGTYRIYGYPEMPEGVYNHAGLYAELLVTVEENQNGGDEDQYPDVEHGNLIRNGVLSESGSGLHPVTDAVDGDTETRWEGNAIKGGAATTTSWIMADLGPNRQISAEQVNVKFYLKTYATDYDLQASEDGTNWTTVKTITHENGDQKDPVDEIKPDQAISKRYVRLFFRSMNSNAAGHAVGIRELEVIGSRRSNQTPDPECTCAIENIKLADCTVKIPANAENASIDLSASASLGGSCQVQGHLDGKITYSYRISEDISQIGFLSGNRLTVNNAGKLEVEVTAQLPGTSAAAVKKTAEITVTKEQTPDPVCTCTIENLQIANQNVVIPGKVNTASIPLKASASVEGSCQAEGHKSLNITYSYRITEDPGKIGFMNAGVLTVSGEGNLKVEVTAQLPGSNAKEAAKTAAISVTKEKANIQIPVTKPEIPAGLNASSAKEKSIRLTWRKAEGADGYILSRYNAKKKTWEDIKTTTSISFENKKLKAATVYQYKVRAYKKSGSSVLEGDEGSICKAATAPVKTPLHAKKSGNRVKLIWTGKARADGFELCMKTGKGKYQPIKKPGKKAKSFTKAGLKKGKTYYFRIRSFKKAGSKKSFSAYSKSVKVSFKN